MSRNCAERKSFPTEWEATAWILDHPPPEPSPDRYAIPCTFCGKYHISEYPEGKNNAKRRSRR